MHVILDDYDKTGYMSLISTLCTNFYSISLRYLIISWSNEWNFSTFSNERELLCWNLNFPENIRIIKMTLNLILKKPEF